MRIRHALPFAAALIAALIAAISAGVFLQAKPDAATGRTTAPEGASSVPAVARASAPAHGFFDMAMTQPSAQAGRKNEGQAWRAVEAKLADATSLRAFVYDMLRRPKEGSVFYAFTTLTRCKTNLKKDGAGLPEPQRQAIEALRARCDFSEQELRDAMRQIVAIRGLNFADDPVIGPISRFLNAKDDGAAAAVLGEMIDGGDPMAIGAVVSRAARHALPADLAPEGQNASDYANYTAMLVECELGAACSGERSLILTDLCTLHGWCAGNVRDALRGGLGDRFAPVDTLATRMTNDVRRRNYAPLLQRD